MKQSRLWEMQWKTHDEGTHEFDLLWDFHGVEEKAMKYIQIFHGVQIHGNLRGWKIHGSGLSP